MDETSVEHAPIGRGLIAFSSKALRGASIGGALSSRPFCLRGLVAFKTMDFTQGKNGSSELPPLGGSLADRIAYKLVEWWLWSIWWRHDGRISGKPPDEPFVIVANHGSYLDWMLLHVLVRHHFRRNVRFFAKRKVVENRWLKLAIKAASPVVVQEKSADRCLATAAHELKTSKEQNSGEHVAICIFPERGRSRTGKQLPNAPGAAWLSRNCKVPILPVALCGFWEVWPPHKRLPSFTRRNLSIKILPPIPPSDFGDDQAAVNHAMNLVYEVVLEEKNKRPNHNGNSI